MATTQETAALIAKIPDAIEATEYKYFGDYEMSEDQRDAVDVLVNAATALTQLQARVAELEAENARLREALQPFARAAEWWKAFHDYQRITSLHQHGDCLEVVHLRAARQALNGDTSHDQ